MPVERASCGGPIVSRALSLLAATSLVEKLFHLFTISPESELFDTVLENCRLKLHQYRTSARAVCVRKRPQHGPTDANSINSPVRVAESSSTGNSYRRGRFGWRGTAAIMTPSNYSCPACNAKLLKRQRGEPAKPGEQAFCPHCMAQLPARDGPYTLGYEFIEGPSGDR